MGDSLWDLGGPARNDAEAAARKEIDAYANRPIPLELLRRCGLPPDTEMECALCFEVYCMAQGCARCLGPGRGGPPPSLEPP